MWDDGYDEALLPVPVGLARLEALLADAGDDERHDFVIVIPVADSPRQTARLPRQPAGTVPRLRLRRHGRRRYRKLRVLLADDSADAAAIAAHRRIAANSMARGLAVEYFGLSNNWRCWTGLPDAAGWPASSATRARAFAHKGQAMMRNIAYLRLRGACARRDPRTLFYTVDADQSNSRSRSATPRAGVEVCAVNFLYHLDEIFRAATRRVLTGKVVGDPPVSPAVMAGNFLDDVIGLLRELAPSDPRQAYRQPAGRPARPATPRITTWPTCSASSPPEDAYRYRCACPARRATPTACAISHAA
jgi:hypothetical protein